MLLELSEELVLLGTGLETPMSVFRRSIDELQRNLLVGETLSRLSRQALAQSDRTLLGADATSTNHDEILLDQTIMRETALQLK